MYQAIITKLKNVRKHPNADRLQLADCHGYQVIVGLDSTEGDLGIYFPTDGQLSSEFCKANDLLARVNPETGVKEGGLFDHKCKVRTQKLRGEKSEGFWVPISYLYTFMGFVSNADYSPVSTDFQYNEGDTITEWNGHLLCARYETPQTKKSAANQKQGNPRPKSKWFPEHVDTLQFLYEMNNIPVGSVIYISEKIHGTSQRQALAYTQHILTWWQRLINRFKKIYPESSYQHMIGTRRCVLNDKKPDFYNDKYFRYNVAIDKVLLKPGEIVYGEVVGYTTARKLIMTEQPTNKTKEKAVIAQYGENMAYTYGCAPDGTIKPQQDYYAYRIQYINPELEQRELKNDEFHLRCKTLGIKPVPLLTSLQYTGDIEALKELVISLAEGPSTIDPLHIKEGVVLRVETPDGRIYFLKYKSFLFRVLEGIAKEDDTFEDIEEAS